MSVSDENMPEIPPATGAAIEAREAEVLGKPARIAIGREGKDIEQVRDATGRLRADLFGITEPLPDEQIPEIMFTMQPFGKSWERLIGMSMQLLGPEALLPRRAQKLAILRTAWLLMAPYEWGEHAGQAKAQGFTTDELQRIAEEGSASPAWTPMEAAILRTCEELRENAMLSEATWDALAAGLSTDQIFELLVLIGQFTTVAFFQNSLRLPLETGNAGLTTR